MKKIIIIQSVVIILLSIILCVVIKINNVTFKTTFQKNTTVKKPTQKTKNILIIGNSISLHGICDYWWGNWGMAASDKEQDYAHILLNKMNQDTPTALEIYNFATWETNAHDRSQTLSDLDHLFNKKYDYVIIQLGENAGDISTFESDFNELIKYVKSYNQSTKIIIVGNFWKNKKLDIYKEQIAKNINAPFINLQNIDNGYYYAKIGTKVMGEDNNIHIIEHQGVARHPNDKAMKYIAEKIYTKINDK